MDKPSSSYEDHKHLINSVSELTVRLVKMEEFIKEHSTRAQATDVSVAGLSNEVDKLSATHSPERESLRSVRGNFPQSYLRYMMTSLSLPGMKFIGEKCLHSYLWVFIHLVFLFISYVYIKEEYDNWQSSPVIKSISNNSTYVNEIPFPAITVCLPGSIRNDYDYRGKIEKCISCNFTDFLYDSCVFNEICSQEEKASLAIASLICLYGSNSSVDPWKIFEDKGKSFIGGSEFSMYSKTLWSPCGMDIEQKRKTNYNVDRYTIVMVTMLGLYGNSYLHFVSSSGMCFTMNGLKREDILKKNITFTKAISGKRHELDSGVIYKGKDFTLENMIYSNGSIWTTPAYLSETDEILFSISGKDYEESAEFCIKNKTDFNDAYFAIHHPVEIPFIFNNDFDLKIGEVKELRVIPEMIVTEKGLEGYKPSERGCFYSYERELSMFKRYSESNCKTECIANCSLQYCGCVPYYLPRHNSSVNVCLADCLDTIYCDRKACGCLPDCYSLSYGFEIKSLEKTKFDLTKVPKGTLYIRFKVSSFYPTLRVSLTNLAQFVAYCLGIVGVFNGFSVMMIFEIFYLFTFKLWDSVKSSFK